MRLLSIYRSESFRLAALFAGLFLALSAVLIGAVFWIVDDAQVAALRAANDADIATIESGLREQGGNEARELVDQLLGSSGYVGTHPAHAYMRYEDLTSGATAGNFLAAGRPVGASTLNGPRGDQVLGRGLYIAPHIYVYVGRDTRQIAATRARILNAFSWIAAAAVVLAGCGGIFFGRLYTRRIDAMTRTCRAIIAGEYGERIPLRGSGELDRLASAINEMLSRIAALLDNLRQVSSDVAHDLRTPLTHLRNRLEEARSTAVTPEDYSSFVARAIEDTDQLLALFAAILRISQIEAGTRQASFSRVSLSGILQNACDLYRPVAEDHQHAMSIDVQDDIHIQGDAELLTQMFSNLIENAIRHTPAQASIRIGLKTSEGSAVARVADDGPGIPAADHDKVLRRFYRSSHSRSTPGHGLGLALVAAIANLHRAALTLADERPGLCVSVAFERAPAPESDAYSTPRSARNSPKILAV